MFFFRRKKIKLSVKIPKKNKNTNFFQNEIFFSKAIEACLSEDWASIPGIKKGELNKNLWKSNPKVALNWLVAICNQADAERDNQNWVVASSLYEAAYKLAPWRIDLKIQMGNMTKDSGFLEKAEKIYRSIITDFPEEPESYVQLGHVYKISGRRQAAINCYQKALKLDEKCEAAYKELYLAGETAIQQTTFTQKNIFLGLEKTLEISNQIDALKQSVKKIAQNIPDIKTFNAIPKDNYDIFRKLFLIPSPNTQRHVSVTFIIKQDNISPETLYRQIAAFSKLDFNFFIVTVDASDQIRENWNRSPNLLNRIVHVSNIYDFSKIPKADVVVLLDSKCVPHPLFIPWISMAFCQKVDIVYCDQEIINDNGQKIVTRPNIDRIWIEQVNIIGNSLFISWDKWRNSPQIEVDKFISHLLKIDGDIHISHIPYPLLSTTKDFLDLKINFQTKIPQFFEKNSKSNSFSIIICTKNNSQDCLRMVNSINCKSSSKNEIEILVISNNTDNNEDIENLKKLNNIKNVRLYHDNGIFNWSYLNNKFAKMAKNKILLFCNDDMEILTENWDEIISQIINSSDTGIIGTKLIYKNNTIQHGGILFGWQNSVIHDGLFEDKNSTEQFARWQCTRKVSAVTGAFLAIRKDIFFEVGGFDDKEMPISYSDVDLCLKVKEKGLSVIWTPLIEVRHDESVSRGLDHLNNFKAERCNTERLALEAKWGKDTFSSDFSVHPMWLDATLPFRLLQPVSLEKALNYIKSYKL